MRDHEFFSKLEEQVRDGRVTGAVHAIRSLNFKKIAREDKIRIAALARRAGASQLAVRLLNPVVRREKGSHVAPPSPHEQAEYAMSLALLGVVPEALAILSRIDADQAPESLLFSAFAHVLEWNYEEAGKLLERYIRYPVPEYQKLIAGVNLAAALVHGQHADRAKEQIARTMEAADRAGTGRLLANIHGIAAQLELQLGNVPAARARLAQAAERLAGGGAVDHLVIEKWLAFCALEENPGAESAMVNLLRLRAKALGLHVWEIVRDVDRRLALRSASTRHLHHVYFGTPMPHYRRLLLAELAPGVALPLVYAWSPGSELGAVPRQLVDFSSTAGRDSVIQGALRVLASDFYRPFRPGFLFSRLFPNEYFNPLSSVHRIHELVRRTRSWLAEENLPITILQEGGQYRLSADDGFAIRVELNPLHQTSLESALVRLRVRFASIPFSARGAAEVLGTSGRTTRRILAQAREEGLVEVSGEKKNRLYVMRSAEVRRAAA